MPAPDPAVLIVDDEPSLCGALRELLAARGYASAAAANGVEALEYLRSHPLPSVILLDLRMPEMDGWEFRARQLADPKLAGIPIIVLTGYNDDPRAGEIAAAAYFPKPFHIRLLLDTVVHLCEGEEPADEAAPPSPGA